MNANNFEMWRKNNRSFEAMAVMQDNPMPMGTGDHPVEVQVLSATSGLFFVLGTSPSLGRAFTEAETQAGRTTSWF